MIIRYYTSNMPLQQILGIILTALLLWGGSFLGHSTWVPQVDLEPLGFYLFQIAYQYPLPASFFCMLMVVFQSFWINSLSHQVKFTAHTSYLTAFIYLLIAGTFEGHFLPGPAVIAGFFVLGVFQAMINAYFQRDMHSNIFHASLFSGIGALFYWPLWGFWLFILIGLLVYRDLTARKTLLVLLGLVPPLAGVMLYQYSRHIEIRYFYMLGQGLADWNISLVLSVPEALLFSLISLYLLISVVYVTHKSGERVMSTQRFIIMINWYFLIVILLGGLAQDLKQHMMILFAPLALYLGSVIEKKRKKFLFEISLWLYLLFIVIYRFEEEIQNLLGTDFTIIRIF